MGQESLGKYISAIYRHLQVLINYELSEYGIGSGQYYFFIQICGNEGISQKELSRLMKIDKATTAKAIKKLETEGYIERVQNQTDKRYNHLYLTKKGRAFVPVFREKMAGITTILSQGMTEEQRNITLNTLKFMLQNTISAIDDIKHTDARQAE